MQALHRGCHVRAPCGTKSQGKCRARTVRVRADARTKGLADPAISLVQGAVTEGPDLSVTVNGLKLPNPFVIGSGPPGTNYQVMKKAFDEGWGAVICKTLSLDSSKVGKLDSATAHFCRKLHCSRCAQKIQWWLDLQLTSISETYCI